MRPNIDHQEKTLIMCNCGHRDDQLWIYRDSQYDNDDYWISVVSDTKSLWECLKWWWFHRKMYFIEMQVNDDDLRKIANTIYDYLERKEKI